MGKGEMNWGWRGGRGGEGGVGRGGVNESMDDCVLFRRFSCTTSGIAMLCCLPNELSPLLKPKAESTSQPQQLIQPLLSHVMTTRKYNSQDQGSAMDQMQVSMR